VLSRLVGSSGGRASLASEWCASCSSWVRLTQTTWQSVVAESVRELLVYIADVIEM
jgi:hypothetical protein